MKLHWRGTFSVTPFTRNISFPWASFDASRGGSGVDTAREQFSVRAEKRCALNSHFRSRTRLRLTPCCSDFLPAGDERFRREDARRTSRAWFSFLWQRPARNFADSYPRVAPTPAQSAVCLDYRGPMPRGHAMVFDRSVAVITRR